MDDSTSVNIIAADIDDNVAFLLNHGMTLEEIEKMSRKHDLPISEIAESARRIVAEGRTFLDGPETFTLEEIQNGEAFAYLADIRDPYRQSMELERLAQDARRLKFSGFKKHFREYLASLSLASPAARQAPAEAGQSSYTAFMSQPLRLRTGEWTAWDAGVWRFAHGEKDYACSHAILPVQIIRSVDTRRLKVRLNFRRGGKGWEEVVVDSEKLASATKIVDALAPAGISVTSGRRACALVDYLRDMLDLNVGTIPEAKSVSRMGWNDDGFYPYTGSGAIIFDSIEYFRSIHDAVRQVGDYETWLQEALDARSYSPAARVALAASFAAPLVKPLGILCFFVHLWGGSGTGKTVAQMLGASVWGYPAPGGPFFPSFDSTTVALEVIAGFLHSIPLFLDEFQIQRGNRWQDFDPYKLTTGAGRLRANKNLGLNYTPEWQTCFITSGETPIIRETDGEGALNRAFEVECKTGEPVIRDGHRTAEALKGNYGHAGKIFVERLTAENLTRARKLYAEYYRILSASDTTGKQAMAAAAILTADALATEWIFRDDRALTVDDISGFLKSKETVSLTNRGYRTICDWVAMNSARFRGVQDAGNAVCYGIVEGGMAYIIRTAFNQFCAESGFDNKALLSNFRAAGLIETGEKGYTKSKRIGGQLANCVFLRLPQSGEESDDADEIPL